MSERYEMDVVPVGAHHWLDDDIAEEIPEALSAKDAPDLDGLDPVQRSQKTVQWFNKTRQDHELERRLIAVRKITTETLFEGK